MNDRSRGQILRQVRHEIHRRLVNHVLRAQHLQGIINGGLFGDAATSSSMSFCPTTDTIVNLIMDNIDTNEDMVVNATVDGTEMVNQLLEMMNSGDSSCGAEAGSARPCLPLANLDATQIAEYMRAHVMQRLMDGQVEDREQTLRETVKLLIQHAQKTGRQLHSLLLLLADLLPQPDSPEISSQQIRNGADMFKDLMNMLTSVYTPQLENHFHYSPFGVDGVAQQLGDLSALAIEVMSFLENADYQFENTESEADSLVEKTASSKGRNPHIPTEGKARQGKDTQTTAVPATSSPSSSSILPDAAPPLERENPPVADGFDEGHLQLQEEGHEGGTGNAATEVDGSGKGVAYKGSQETKGKKTKPTSRKRPSTASPERTRDKGYKDDHDRDGPGGLRRYLVPK